MRVASRCHVIAVVIAFVTACGDRDASPRTDNAPLDGSVLPDTPSAPVSLAPTDTTDVSNYQAAGWWLGTDGARGRSRFSMSFERFSSGILLLKLDTLLDRDRAEPPFDSALADSIAISGLPTAARVATRCRVTGNEPDDFIVGLLPDTVTERWARPRAAWLVDTLSSRFRRLRPDSLDCWLAPNPD